MQRYRAEWAIRNKEVVGPLLVSALGYLQRALAINPTDPESLAEKASLGMLDAGAKEEARGKLAVCLKQNRFLGLEYREYLDLAHTGTAQTIRDRATNQAGVAVR